MEENKKDFSTDNIEEFKMKLLHWASRFSIFCFLDNSNYRQKYQSVECLLAVGVKRSVELSGHGAFDNLQSFHNDKPAWVFGHFSYEITKEKTLQKEHAFSPGYFFEPEIVIRVYDDHISIETNDSSDTNAEIFNDISTITIHTTTPGNAVSIQSRLSRSEYLRIIAEIKAHIRRGDCYELNFCQEFFAEHVSIDVLDVYKKLQEISPNPFSAFYKVRNNYCLCASPERYIQKRGSQLISQPIKGTVKRSSDPETDAKNRAHLISSNKEKSENVMIVDLVRNDLSKVCEEGSVVVEEMFGIYSFPQVYQMISTIKGTLGADVPFTKAIEATFPMGSMTGAPKKKVMELIEKFESGERGLFSGSIGYIDPHGNFDFNVVIRSIFYNSEAKYLSYWAGGGITFYSEPQQEYEECLAKVEAIKKALC